MAPGPSGRTGRATGSGSPSVAARPRRARARGPPRPGPGPRRCALRRAGPSKVTTVVGSVAMTVEVARWGGTRADQPMQSPGSTVRTVTAVRPGTASRMASRPSTTTPNESTSAPSRSMTAPAGTEVELGERGQTGPGRVRKTCPEPSRCQRGIDPSVHGHDEQPPWSLSTVRVVRSPGTGRSARKEGHPVLPGGPFPAA